ncbi:MAG: hypothetical protein IJQ23_01490 [Clostridia bacterium]|nr:hypothetical protein [Clostridia bacterium]
MAEWLISVFTAVFVVSVLSILLPEGRLSKFVKPLISLVVIIIVVTPLTNSEGYTENFTKESNAEIKTDADFLGYITRSKIDLYIKNCVKIAEKNGINGSEILIEYSIDDNFTIKISAVLVNLKNAVISSDDEHIVILQRLSSEISDYLKIDASKVTIYE